MQAAVKTPRTEIRIKGEIPNHVLAVLKAEYGDQLVIEKNDDDEAINVFETTWYKATKAGTIIHRDQTYTLLGKQTGELTS